jgi:hypothetical protein
VTLAARPEVTGRKSAGPNLFLIEYQDDDILEREELAREWRCTTRTLRNYQNSIDGLPFFLHGGKVHHRAGSVREWMRRREHRLNQRRGDR